MIRSEKFLKIMAYLYTAIALVLILMPLAWTISTSFKQVGDIYKVPPSFLPPMPNRIHFYVNYDEIASGLDSEELLDVIKKDSMMLIYGVKKDFNKTNNDNKIFRYEYYGTVDGRIIFSFAANQSEVSFSQGYMKTNAYRAHNVEKYYFDLIENMGYQYNISGISNKHYSYKETPKSLKEDIYEWQENTDFSIAGSLDSYVMKNFLLGLIDNYISGWNSLNDSENKFGFGLYFMNSIIITLSTILGQIFICALAGYALSRLIGSKMTKFLLMFFLATMMLPWFTTLIPTYILVKDLNWLGTYLPMIIPGFANAFLIYIFKGFFDTLPNDLFACARIDGANEFIVFCKICIPLSKAVVGVAVMMIFFSSWNEFMWPNIVTMGNPKISPFPVMLFRTSENILPGARIALSVIAALPTLFIFGIFNKYIEKGIVWTGIKG